MECKRLIEVIRAQTIVLKYLSQKIYREGHSLTYYIERLTVLLDFGADLPLPNPVSITRVLFR